MNIKIIIGLIMFLNATLQQRSVLENILQPKVNFLRKTNVKIHRTMNKMFMSLKTDKNFTKSNNFQMLLAMHSYLNSLSEISYEIYEKLNTIVENFEKSQTNFNELLQNTVKEAFDITKNNVMKLTQKPNKSEFLTIFPKSKDTNDSQKHFIEMIKSSNKSIEIMIESVIKENLASDTLTITYNKIRNTKIKKLRENEMKWSQLNDKTMENIIDQIVDENKSLDATATKTISHNRSREPNTWHPKMRRFETRRIYKGRKTKIKNYPFVASLHLMSEFLCVGSMIAMDMVLTSASCLQIVFKNKVYQDDPRTIFVRLGSDHTKHSGKLVPVVKVIFHPDYDPVTLKHNIAIVKMLKNLNNLKKRKIKKIKYDKSPQFLPKSVKEITVLGWGAKDEKDEVKGSQSLAMTHLDIYNIKACQDIYSKYYVTETNFCAGFTSKGGGACIGDVGGPAVVGETLVGLVSFGPTVCGMPDAPTVFTKIGHYADWIDGVLNKKSGEEKTSVTKIHKPIGHTMLIIPLFTTLSDTTQTISNATYLEPHTTRTDSHTTKIVSLTTNTVSDTTNTESHKTDSKSHKTHTVSHTTHNVSHTTHKSPQTKRFLLKPIIRQQSEREEIEVLKTLISEFILGNHTVIDYLTNADFYEDETEPIYNMPNDESDLLLDLKRFKRIELQNNLLRTTKSAKHVNKNKVKQIKTYEDAPYFLKPKKSKFKIQQATNITKSTRDRVYYKPTKLATFIESDEFPVNDFSSDLDFKSLLLYDGSSYYEEGIPIDDTPFKKTKRPLDSKIEATKMPKITEAIKYENNNDLFKENYIFNFHPIPNLKIKYPEKRFYNIPRDVMEFEPTTNDVLKKPYHGYNLDSSDSGDTVVHFVTSKPHKNGDKGNFYKRYTKLDT